MRPDMKKQKSNNEAKVMPIFLLGGIDASTKDIYVSISTQYNNWPLDFVT